MEEFRAYAAAVEGRMRQGAPFLFLADDEAVRAKLREGPAVAVTAKSLGLGSDLPNEGGQVQHWVGAVFVPRGTLNRARPALLDYANRTRYMAPEIRESSVLSRRGDELQVHLRLAENSMIPGIFDVRLNIRYRDVDRRRLAIDSRSEDVLDVTAAAPKDRGLLWGLNHYWRIEESGDGLYLECEALVLSRRTPVALGWLADPLISQAARKTLINTLLATRRMLETTVS